MKYNTLGERLKFFREMAGFTQYEIEEDLHITHGLLAKYEHDRCAPQLGTFHMMCKKYNASADVILGLKEYDFKVGREALIMAQIKKLERKINSLQEEMNNHES